MAEADIGYSGACTTHYSVRREHSRIEGIVQLPIASNAGRSSFVRLHGGMEQEVVYWSASRRGAAPILPSWRAFLTNGNTNRVFLDGERTAEIPVPILGGMHAFVVAGYYRYGLILAENLDSHFALGSYPWEVVPVAENFIPASHFTPTLVLSTLAPSQIVHGAWYPPKTIPNANPISQYPPPRPRPETFRENQTPDTVRPRPLQNPIAG